MIGKFGFAGDGRFTYCLAMGKSHPFPNVARRSGGLLAILLAGLTPFAADAADLVPHQAIYKLRLAEVHSTSNFNGVTGAAVSLLERGCEGWNIDEQVVMTMQTNVGGTINSETTFKATESLDGRNYRFKHFSNTEGTVEEHKGSARFKADGKPEAEYITPKPMEMPLPDGVRFYISTTAWLVDLAKTGAKTGETMTFDGSDGSGALKITAFILPDRSNPKLNGDPKLLAGQAWKVRLAFFKTKGQASKPEFEIDLRLLENGIVTYYKQIFDDIAIDQILEDLLPAKDEKCG